MNLAEEQGAFHSLVKAFVYYLHTWAASISHPRNFLSPMYRPSEDQIIPGLEFYFVVIGASLILYVPFVLTHKSELGDRARLAANGALSLVNSAVLAMCWHFAFSLLGGKADFAGTYLAYIYGAAPYLPLISIVSLIAFAGLPSELQPYALSPATGQVVFQQGMSDPRAKKGLVALGGILSFGLIVWSAVVQFRCLSFVHKLVGWRLLGAITLSAVFTAPLAAIFKAMASLFTPPLPSSQQPAPAAISQQGATLTNIQQSPSAEPKAAPERAP